MQPQAEVIDKEGLLRRIEGDLELFREIAGIFFEDCPKLLSAIRSAVHNQDARALERAAHTLKGCVANFTTGPVYTTAFQLETIGRSGDLEQASHACTALESHIETFHRALHALSAELAKS